ncbi:MAG TPA: Jag N-terminal domain-containing protein, partial [Thermoanaerobaculia bacterium]|nr:Jag N-terminal domain-containing protein [Thermoanaerobaculia bacterium]
MSQRFEGHNLEEALQNAAQTLGVERWQLTYHVLLEKRGFLGGVKRIVLEADVNTSAPPPAAAYTPAPYDAPPRPPRAARGGGGGGRGPRPGGGSGGGRDRGGRAGGRRGGRGNRDHG